MHVSIENILEILPSQIYHDALYHAFGLVLSKTYV